MVALPLQQGGFGIGLIARKYKSILLGYFFNCIYPLVPTEILTDKIDIKDFVLIGKFNSGGIENREWPVLKTDLYFNKERWPVPTFMRQDLITGKYFAVINDDTLVNERRYSIAKEKADSLYSHVIFGYGALEEKLSRILGENITGTENLKA